MKINPHTFFTLAVNGGEWSDSCTVHFTPWDEPMVPEGRRLNGPQS